MIKNRNWNRLLFIAVLLVNGACSYKPAASNASRVPQGQSDLPALRNLPSQIAEVETAINRARIPADKAALARQKIISYFKFLGLDPHQDSGKKVLDRLFNSSTMFLFCDDINNWECLEQKPFIQPTQDWRQEARNDLGRPQRLNRALNYQYFFTEQYATPAANKNLSMSMANKLSHILDGQWNSISLAIYGIDDINGTMRSVFQSVSEQRKRGTTLKAVVDTEGYGTNLPSGKVLFSHQGLRPGAAPYNSAHGWSTAAMNYQYDGTPDLIRELNSGVTSERDTNARQEWPDTGIMHNKFIVFKRGTSSSVWMGSANIAKTCMGDESNANMTLMINDDAIAGAYDTEFKEMYDFSSEPYRDPGHRIVNSDGNAQIQIGRFHRRKTANTNRYFVFNDGTEVRVHFSPTDDGEHRVLLPMLLSARNGDEIRIAMFGSGGVELIRALQYAAAQGAHIRIAFDRMQVSVPGSWLNNPDMNLTQPNPYNASASQNIEYKRSAWQGLNHHKTATLTRRKANGQMLVETFIVGSQNWSASGNDDNDENMLSMRNTQTGVEAGRAFNQHFDQKIWSSSQ